MRFSDRARLARSEAILEAAERVAARRGWPAVTIEAVAQESGVAKGTVYLHYDGKDALLAALADRAVHQLVTVVEDAVHVDEDPTDQLHAIFRRLVSETEHRRAVQTLVHSLTCPASIARGRSVDLTNRFSDAIVKLVRRGKVQGTLAPDFDASAAAATLVVLALGAEWALGSDPTAAALDNLWAFYARAIGVHHSGSNLPE